MTNLSSYDYLILGSPINFGSFKGSVKKFLKKHKRDLRPIKLLLFFTGLYIVKDSSRKSFDFSIFIDPAFEPTTKPLNQMGLMDKTHSDSHYIGKITKTVPSLKIEEMAFFKGRLNLNSLGFFERLLMKFMTLVSDKEKEGDFLNPAAVRAWASRVKSTLLQTGVQ